jgi:FkbM family methyltransferase
MNQTLRHIVSLFPFFVRLRIFFILFKQKLRINISNKDYLLLSEIAEYTDYIERHGKLKKAVGNTICAQIMINRMALALIVRRNNSDWKVFKTICLSNEYGAAISWLSQFNYNEFTIIDAGANIGATSLYFHNFFPSTRIIAIEPDNDNFIMLNNNINLNKANRLIFAEKLALWPSNSYLRISKNFRDGQSWALSVEQSESIEELQGASLKDIINRNNIQGKIFLKIDIEGAEKYLFRDKDFVETLKKNVFMIVIEIHDEFNIREEICLTMNNIGFELVDEQKVSLFVKKYF